MTGAELRIAVVAENPPFSFKEGDKLTGLEVELGEQLAKEMDVRRRSSSPMRLTCCREWRAASTTWR